MLAAGARPAFLLRPALPEPLPSHSLRVRASPFPGTLAVLNARVFPLMGICVRRRGARATLEYGHFCLQGACAPSQKPGALEGVAL